MRRARGVCVGLAILLVGGLCGCNAARVVATGPNTCVVAIPDNSNGWPSYNHKRAEELLAKKFPQGYVIESESEVVTGQNTITNTEGESTKLTKTVGLNTSRQTTTTSDVKEWHIKAYGRTPTGAPGVALAPNASVPPGAPPGMPIQRVSFPTGQTPLPNEPMPIQH